MRWPVLFRKWDSDGVDGDVITLLLIVFTRASSSDVALLANPAPCSSLRIATFLLASGKRGGLADAAGGNWLFTAPLVDQHHGF
jgi:hypothetical protein